jgi:hypothetical protein
MEGLRQFKAIDTESKSVQLRNSESSLSKMAEFKSSCAHKDGTYGALTGTTVLQQGVIWGPTSFFLTGHSTLTILNACKNSTQHYQTYHTYSTIHTSFTTDQRADHHTQL